MSELVKGAFVKKYGQNANEYLAKFKIFDSAEQMKRIADILTMRELHSSGVR